MSNNGAFIVGGFPECEYLLKLPVRFNPTHGKNNMLTFADCTAHCFIGNAPEKIKVRSKCSEHKVATCYKGTLFQSSALTDYIIALLLWLGRIWSPFVSRGCVSKPKHEPFCSFAPYASCWIHVSFVRHHLLFTLFSSHWTLILQHSSFIHKLLSVSREMVLISCLDSVEGVKVWANSEWFLKSMYN